MPFQFGISMITEVTTVPAMAAATRRRKVWRVMSFIGREPFYSPSGGGRRAGIASADRDLEAGSG
jgi:hypothetical protein